MNNHPEKMMRISTLRDELARQNLSGFIIPHADEYQNEYTPDSAERLKWLTGFTGSAGTAAILGEQGAIFVDGRYVLQVKSEVHSECFVPYHSAEISVTDWLSSTLIPGAKLGYDPWLHTAQEVERLRTVCEQAQAELIACTSNPVDEVWVNRPEVPRTPMVPHPLRFTGRDSSEKRAELANALKNQRIDAAIVTTPDSLGWLLNVRGRDVGYTPLSLCMGIFFADGSVKLFVDPQKINPQLIDHLGPTISIFPADAFGPELEGLGQQGCRVLYDPKKSASWILDRLTQGSAPVVYGEDPCALPKACKNKTEAQGARDAHVRDGAALCRFLGWLAREATNGKVTELDAAEYLDSVRQKNDFWQDMSFPTISGAGANGAIVHYRSTHETNARLLPNSLYLVDSGAQYFDGTTDVTRTVAIGIPTAEHRDRYTRVLKGHIALATARFPRGTTGSQLDVLARKPLWDAGLDYDHGTGHGVGSYLGVHEGPQRISKSGGSVALLPGMIVSNEPGYYKSGEYGIRIENLVLVVPCSAVVAGERELLAFETLTLAPLDRNLIEPSLLQQDEVAWI
ncbi:MAG: M24 family metallopeptidase, partial [Nitrospirales bacterium]